MTLSELQNEISALGLGDWSDYEVALSFATRRALNYLYNELHITARAKFFVKSHKPTSRTPHLHHKGGGAEALPLEGRAYAMTVSGVGRIRIMDGSNTHLIDFDSKRKIIKGFIKSGGLIVFEGKYSYDVYNLAVYAEAYGEELCDIPDDIDFCTVDVRGQCKDFLSFTSAATDENGEPILSALLEDGMIRLPSGYCGEVNVTYRRLPKPPTLTLPDEPLDIPPEYEAPLPLLTAFYILLNEDEEKALVYKDACSEMLDGIKRSARPRVELSYKNVTGW